MQPLTASRAWLERAVIGLDLCPFAKAVHARGRVRWVLSPARTADQLLAELAAEMQWLAHAPADDVDTTLVVHPQVLQRFADFNRFLDVADAALEVLGLDGTLQVASFHPRYRFAGTRADDIANATNRAPHPTLQLLREASVARAVAAFPDPAAIYERNVATLRRLGPGGWRRLMAGDGG